MGARIRMPSLLGGRIPGRVTFRACGAARATIGRENASQEPIGKVLFLSTRKGWIPRGRLTVNSLNNNPKSNSSKINFHPGCGGGAHKAEEPWRSLLHDAAPKEHIVQLYQDEQFLNRA